MAIPSTLFRTVAVSGATRAGGISSAAGARSTVKIYGVPEALAKLVQVRQVVYRDIGLIIYRGAQNTVKIAKTKITPHSGNLQKGIKAEKRGAYTWAITASSVDGGSNREYAGYVEFGTSKMTPRPYLRPALAESRKGVVRDLNLLARKLEVL